MFTLEFDAAAVRKLGGRHSLSLWLHSSQSPDGATGSVWLSSRSDSLPPRVYAGGCTPGTPLGWINANIGSYDTLRERIDGNALLPALDSYLGAYLVLPSDPTARARLSTAKLKPAKGYVHLLYDDSRFELSVSASMDYPEISQAYP